MKISSTKSHVIKLAVYDWTLKTEGLVRLLLAVIFWKQFFVNQQNFVVE